jgi:hypothetical protein
MAMVIGEAALLAGVATPRVATRAATTAKPNEKRAIADRKAAPSGFLWPPGSIRTLPVIDIDINIEDFGSSV